MRVQVTDSSQEEILLAAMRNAKITHDADVEVVIPNVRVDSGVVYFCAVSQVKVQSINRLGDGRSLPEQVTMTQPLQVDKRGYYNLYARLCVNGTVAIQEATATLVSTY